MPKRRQTIAVDVDDVLAAVSQAMMNFVNQHFATNHNWGDYTAPGDYHRYWEKTVWQVAQEEGDRRYNAFIESGAQRTAPPVADSITVINHLKKKYDLVVITARPHQHMDETHEWLAQHFPETFRDVHFLPIGDDGKKIPKGEFGQQIGIDFLIDDLLDHILPAAEAGITGLLFGEYGWNRQVELPPSVVRVQDWQAVKEYFDARG